MYSLCKNNAISKSFEQITGLSHPYYCVHKHYTNSDYTLVRVSKTTFCNDNGYKV